MSRVLSQEEIDMLVSAISSGEVKTKEEKIEIKRDKVVRTYNFKASGRLSKDSLRYLENVYEDFCRLVSDSLAAYLRTHVEVSHVKTDQVSYGELVYGEEEDKSKATVISLFVFSPLQGNGILQIDLSMAFSIIDRMFGGPGWANQKLRKLTALEKEMISQVFQKILVNFAESWVKVKELTPQITVLETDPRMLPRVVPFHEIITRSTFGVKVGENFSLMKLAVPHDLLSPLLGKLQEKEESKTRINVENRDRNFLMQWIGMIKLPLLVELGKATISVRELIELKKDYVVLLDKDVNDELDVKLGDKLKFRGRAGTVKGSRAIQITTLIKEAIDENE